MVELIERTAQSSETTRRGCADVHLICSKPLLADLVGHALAAHGFAVRTAAAFAPQADTNAPWLVYLTEREAQALTEIEACARAGVPVVAWLAANQPQLLGRLVDLGVRGVVDLDAGLDCLMNTLATVRAGGTAFPLAALAGLHKAADSSPQPPSLERASPNATANRLHPFTERELEVLDGLRQGKANKIIAFELAICDATVKVHIRHIMRKLGATNRTQAALLAEQLLSEA